MKIKSAWISSILLAVAITAPLVLAQATPAPKPPTTAPKPLPAAPQSQPILAGPPATQEAASAEDEADARATLAERFCDMAMTIARATNYSKIGLRQSAVLLEAAAQQNPVEPRYLRLLAYWREQLGETDNAIATWTRYRTLEPDDRVAQVNQIELYLGRQQSNDAKIKYIKELLAKPTLNEHVKAHLAAQAVPLIDQRSRAEALAMLAEARKYYPLPEVTLLEWQMLPPEATPLQKLKAMLNVVRANPTNTEAIAGVANTLAENGLSEQALGWYSILMGVSNDNETPADQASIINFLAERYRAGETTVANEQLDQLLQRDPDNVEIWLLRLTTQRSDESVQMLQKAQQAFIKHLNDTCDQIVAIPLPPGVTPAVAMEIKVVPATALPPPANVQLAIARAKQLANPRATDALVDALTKQAWFELYYDHRADLSGPVLIALKELRPADDATIRGLDGWYFFVSGDEASARKIFTAQQATAPLSALGLFQLEDSKGHTNEANVIGAKILSNPQLGVVGAALYQATKGRGIKPASPPADAAAVREELEKFPREWLDILRIPKHFYSVRVEPTKVGHRLGEPMFGSVVIENVSKFDICIGDAGPLKSLLCFGAQIRGVNAQTFPAITVDRIMGRLVLPPGESVSQIVRIDQVGLGDALRARPAVLLMLSADVVTNSRPGDAVPHARAAGYAQNFGKMFTRSPFSLALDAGRRNLYEHLAKATPGGKILDLELLAAYYHQYVQPNATDMELTFAQQFLNFIDKSRSDTAPGVKLWASYTYAVLTTGAEERRALADMMASTAWESRLLALYAAQNLPADAIKKMATTASADKDSLVKSFALGLLEMVQTATTMPSVIPATTAPAPVVRPMSTQPSNEAGVREIGATPTTQPGGGK